MHSLLWVSVICTDRLWIFWSGTMADSSGKLHFLLFLSLNCSKLGNGAQRWTIAYLDRILIVLLQLNLLIRLEVIKEESSSLLWPLTFRREEERKRKLRLPWGSERVSSNLQSLMVWEEEVNWVQRKGMHPEMSCVTYLCSERTFNEL